MIKILVSILGILATAGLAAVQPPAQPPVGAATGQPSRTIQVLTDVPRDQILATMRVIAASLGVECEFCHESNRTLNTEKKDVARKMMTMTLALNQASFGAQVRVTCYTCHRGSSTPLAADRAIYRPGGGRSPQRQRLPPAWRTGCGPVGTVS